jgi:hypothetical protein
MTPVDKNHHCCGRHQPPLLLTMTAIAAVDDKHDRWHLAVVVVNCVAAAMALVDGGNSGHC